MKGSFFSLRSRHNLRRTLHNLRVTLLCGLLTFIVLRSSLGAGKFGTPVKDYDEIRHRLHSFRARHQQKLLLTGSEPAAANIAATSRFDASRRSTLSLPTLPSEDEAAASYGELSSRAGLHTSSSSAPRIMLATGSQLGKCESAVEAQFLLKLLKNKMDYCYLHGIDIFFDTETDTDSEVAKFRLIRKLLVSHPEVEWLWWMDSTVMFTTMSRRLPYEMYAGYNVAIHNSGDGMNGIGRSILVRNSKWMLEFLKNSKVPMQWPAAEVMVDNEMKMEVYGPRIGRGNAWPSITDFESCNVCGKGLDPSCLTHIEKAFIFADGQHRHVASL